MVENYYGELWYIDYVLKRNGINILRDIEKES